MSDLVGDYLDSREWAEVGKDQYLSSDSEIIATECLGTCLGVAGYDSRSNQSYLLHASTIENDRLEEQVEDFADDMQDLEGPFEVLAGGTMSSQYNPLSEDDFTGYARNIVEEALQSRNIEYQAAWNEPPQFNRLVVSSEYGILYDTPE